MANIRKTNSFGEHLRNLREEAGLTLKNVSENINIDSSLLSMGSSSSQAGEATSRFLVPTGIDPRRRQQLLRCSWEASRLRQEVKKPHKTLNFWGLRIESSETSQSRRDRRSHLPNSWSCRSSRQWDLPVAGSHWPSGTTDLDGQLTENSEEPKFLRLPVSGPKIINGPENAKKQGIYAPKWLWKCQ